MAFVVVVVVVVVDEEEETDFQRGGPTPLFEQLVSTAVQSPSELRQTNKQATTRAQLKIYSLSSSFQTSRRAFAERARKSIRGCR